MSAPFSGGGSSTPVPTLTKGWHEAIEERRADKDLLCTAAGLTVHMYHLRHCLTALPLVPLVSLIVMGTAHVVTALVNVKRRHLYLQLRPGITAALRLGIVLLPSAVLDTAYRADLAPAGGPGWRLAWRALLASRAFVLLVPAYARRTRLVPQVALSLLAVCLTARGASDVCATPLMQHPRVRQLANGLGQAVVTATGVLLPSMPLPATPAAVSCRRAVLFMQMAVGCVLPTLAYLWEESGAAQRLAAAAGERAAEADWELRFFLAVGRSWRAHGVPALLCIVTCSLGVCWSLSGLL